MITDPITDMLNRIRNAQAVAHPIVRIPFSKFKYKIAEILEQQGFIIKVQKKGRKINRNIELILKYNNGQQAISNLKRISKPGQRIYMSFNEIRIDKGRHGIFIISTSKGLMTNKQARKEKLGGEVLCEIW